MRATLPFRERFVSHVLTNDELVVYMRELTLIPNVKAKIKKRNLNFFFIKRNTVLKFFSK